MSHSPAHRRWNSFVRIARSGILFVSLLFLAFRAFAGVVSLAWDPSADQTVTGYKVYYGPAAGNYPSSIDVGNATAYTVTNLVVGSTYHFAVTAYNAGHVESAYSNDVSATVQSAAPASIAATAGSGQSATVNTAFGAVLQATVKDAANNAVAGAIVTFTLPASGASGTFAGGGKTASATTNASGVASSPVVTANSTVGSYTVTATVSGVATPASFTLTNNAGGTPPAITSLNTTTFVVGSSGSFVFTATGSPVPAIAVTGVLPAGVTYNAGTKTLSGTPGAGTGGSYALTVTASNGVGSNATQAFTLVVNQAPAITSVNTKTFVVGSSGSFVFAATGSPAPAIAVTGALPAGVTYNAGTKTLSGTPGAGTGGSYALTVTASNGVGSNATQAFTLVVNQAPAITSANTITFVVGSSGSFVFAATGSPAPAVAVTGALPAGVTYNAGTKTLSGTPGAGTGGSYALTVTASNGVGSNATQAFTLVVNQAPAITSVNTKTFVVGSSGSFVFTATGLPAPAIAVTGALPAGVTYNAGTKTLSGTPGAGTGGSYALTVTASNGVGSNATQAFTLVVNQAPAITSANSATFKVAVAGTTTVTRTGFPLPTLSVSGTIPAGVTFTPSTGVLAGTPAAGTTGTYGLTFTASNGVGSNATQAFTLTVQAPTPASIVATAGSGQSTTVSTAFGAVLQATVKDAANGAVSGASVTFTLPASGASGTFAGGAKTVAVTTNASGVASSPVITANATVGSYTVAATVAGVATPANFFLTNVVATSSPTITSANTTTFVVGSGGSFVFAATGLPAPAIAVTGALPAGVTYNAGTKTLSGTPGAGTGGSHALTVTASNGVGSNATQAFTLVVNQAPAITSANSATFKVAVAGTTTVTRTGFPLPALSVSGTMPGGVTFTPSTGVLAGTPAAGTTGTYGLTFTASNGVGSNATQAFTLTVQAPTPASIVATAGSGQSTKVSTAFATVLQATVKDAANGAVSGASVTFTLPATGASGTFPGGAKTLTVTTSASGLATSSLVTANGTLGSYSVSATVPGVATPANFTLLNVSGTDPLTVTGGAGQGSRVSTAFAQSLRVQVRDVGGNPTPNATVTWSVPVLGASASLSGVSSLTDVNGNASVTAVANAISGPYQVTANTGGLSANIDLANTITVTQGNVCIANNPTVDDLVEQYYAVVLRRPSDAAGKAFWMGEANRLCLLGIDPKQAFLVLGAVFFNSSEYLGLNRDNNQFVTDTYLAALSRLPDAGGLSYWSGQIVAGLPRSIVLNTFLFAPEFNATMQSVFGSTSSRKENVAVVNVYGGLLRRLPDDSGFNYWVSQLRTAQCQANPAAPMQLAVDSITRQLLTSPEYASRGRTNSEYVQDLYYAFLQRGGDLAGFNFWVSALTNSTLTREQVRTQFLNSPEMQASIAAMAAQGCLP